MSNVDDTGITNPPPSLPPEDVDSSKSTGTGNIDSDLQPDSSNMNVEALIFQCNAMAMQLNDDLNTFRLYESQEAQSLGSEMDQRQDELNSIKLFQENENLQPGQVSQDASEETATTAAIEKLKGELSSVTTDLNQTQQSATNWVNATLGMLDKVMQLVQSVLQRF